MSVRWGRPLKGFAFGAMWTFRHCFNNLTSLLSHSQVGHHIRKGSSILTLAETAWEQLSGSLGLPRFHSIFKTAQPEKQSFHGGTGGNGLDSHALVRPPLLRVPDAFAGQCQAFILFPTRQDKGRRLPPAISRANVPSSKTPPPRRWYWKCDKKRKGRRNGLSFLLPNSSLPMGLPQAWHTQPRGWIPSHAGFSRVSPAAHTGPRAEPPGLGPCVFLFSNMMRV